MAGYVGSVAFDRSETLLAASCPRGAGIAVWRVADGGFVGLIEIADACAIGSAPAPGRFLAASGVGAVVEIDPRAGTLRSLGQRQPVAYDNHLTLL
jgi:hypothetical protein